MIEILNSIDTKIFLFLNGLHTSFLDNFMFAFSEKWIWIPFYAAILFKIVRLWRKESIWIILAIVLCITLADQLTSGLIKNWVQRPRPSQEAGLEGLVHIVNGYRGGHFGFVSSHAANAFGYALFCSLLFRRKLYTRTLFLWAVIIGYSRIYLGVHYPGDFIGGMLVGLFFSRIVFLHVKEIPSASCQSGS